MEVRDRGTGTVDIAPESVLSDEQLELIRTFIVRISNPGIQNLLFFGIESDLAKLMTLERAIDDVIKTCPSGRACTVQQIVRTSGSLWVVIQASYAAPIVSFNPNLATLIRRCCDALITS